MADYTHPDALQRVAERIEVEVWPADRKFFEENPGRSCRLRRAYPIEVTECEIVSESALKVAPGHQICTVVKQLAPGVRMRYLIIADAAAGDPPVDLSEDICQRHFDAALMAHRPDIAREGTRDLERKLAEVIETAEEKSRRQGFEICLLNHRTETEAKRLLANNTGNTKVDQLLVDINPDSVVDSIDEIVRKLTGLPKPPTEILHIGAPPILRVVYQLDPPVCDKRMFVRCAVVGRRLAKTLCGKASFRIIPALGHAEARV